MSPYPLRPATIEDAPAVTECVNAAYRHYLERMELPPGPMMEDYAQVIRDGRVTIAEAEARREGFGSIYLYTHEKMTENQVLYAKIGYAEFHRQTENGRPRVYMRKPLR